MKKETETSHCYALMDWAALHPVCKDFLFHIENERKCSVVQGWIRKRKGVKKGVVDYFLAYPSQGFHGFWFEMKVKGKKLTLEQKEWLDLMHSVGYKIGCYFSWLDAVIALKDYLNEPKKT